MAGMMVKLAVVALVASSMWAVSNAQSGSSDSCTNVLISMSPCLNYITGNSSTPSSSCCTQLESVVKNNPKCLCEVINGGASKLAGININQTQAMGLPGACKVQTPPISRCSAAAGDAPSGTPAGSTPTDATTPQGGSKATPTTEGGSSDASKIMTKAAAVPLFLALSFVAAFSAL